MAFDEDIESSWETDEGGFEPFDGTIIQAEFGYDNTYGDGEPALLILTVKADDPELFEDNDGETRLLYPIGKGWEPADGGATCQHETGRPRKFHVLSGVGALVNAAAQLDGVLDILKSRGPATQANVWEGLRFTFEDVKFSRTDKDGETIEWTRRLPVAFLGVEGEEAEETKPAKKSAKKAATKKSAAKKSEPEPADADTDDGDAEDSDTPELDAKTRGKLKAIAARVDDHDEFMETAFAELDLDDLAEELVADEEFYQGLKAS